MNFYWVNGRTLSGMDLNDGRDSITILTDANGVRFNKEVMSFGGSLGFGSYFYEYNGSQLVRQSGTTGTMWFLYDESGNPVGFTLDDTEYYYLKNLQGDITGITDSNGNIVAKYTYDVWGKILSITDASGNDVSANKNHIANINPIRYRGYYYDSESGLYYLLTRYYDPVTRRFINADGYVSTGQGFTGFNMFAYCGNNPVNRVDYSGSHWYLLWIDDLINLIFNSEESDPEGTSHDVSYTSEEPPVYIPEKNYDVNVYITGEGSNDPDKINVELMPNHIDDGKPNPNIRIHDSYKIRDTNQQKMIMQIVMSSPLYDNTVFTRTCNSYITEWKIHNVLYDLVFFSDELRDRFGTADLDEEELWMVTWDAQW